MCCVVMNAFICEATFEARLRAASDAVSVPSDGRR